MSSEEVSSSGVRIVPRALGTQLVDQTARATLFSRGDITAISGDNEPEPTATAVVTIRIPCGADGDLVTDAEKRLSRGENTDTVTVDEIHGIAPKRSATAITVGITLRWTTTMTDTEVRRRLAEVPGLGSIERIG